MRRAKKLLQEGLDIILLLFVLMVVIGYYSNKPVLEKEFEEYNKESEEIRNQIDSIKQLNNKHYAEN